MSPFFVSMEVAIIATVINFFLGIFAAYAVMNMDRLRPIMDGVFTLSMVLPPTVVGFFLLLIFGAKSPIGQFLGTIGIDLIFTRQAAIVSAVVVSFPLMYRTSLGAFEQVDEDVLSAAISLGVPKFKRFWKILVPMSMPGIVSGIILSFARAMGEFGATIMIAGNIPGKTQTMSTAVYSAVQAGNTEEAFMWSAIIVAISFFMILIMNILSKKFDRSMGK